MTTTLGQYHITQNINFVRSLYVAFTINKQIKIVIVIVNLQNIMESQYMSVGQPVANLGEPTHTLVSCWMSKSLSPRNKCTSCFAPALVTHIHVVWFAFIGSNYMESGSSCVKLCETLHCLGDKGGFGSKSKKLGVQNDSERELSHSSISNIIAQNVMQS